MASCVFLRKEEDAQKSACMGLCLHAMSSNHGETRMRSLLKTLTPQQPELLLPSSARGRWKHWGQILVIRVADLRGVLPKLLATLSLLACFHLDHDIYVALPLDDPAGHARGAKTLTSLNAFAHSSVKRSAVPGS